MADNELDFSNVYTDLALESHEMRSRGDGSVPGVKVEKEQFANGTISRVVVFDQIGAEIMHKPLGNYITIESDQLNSSDTEILEDVSKVLARELGHLMPQAKGTVLVVGLGNWNVTPDALGPRVVDDLLVTRHFVETDPDHADGLGNVCAIAPGVLGTTGIETGEIIQGIVERVKPVCVVAVDALAARSVKRVGTTIQLADSGINPGSGIGNHRQSLSQDTLGIPVIGVGVPTVVHAATIANDTVDLVMDAIKRNNPMASMPQMLGNLSREQTNAMIHEVLQPFMGDLVVTPKEIDKMTEDLARVVAGGMNVALHPDLDIDDTLRYIQ